MHDAWWSRVDSCGHQDTAQGELGYYCEPLSTNTVTCVLSLQTFTNYNTTHRWKYSLRRRENTIYQKYAPTRYFEAKVGRGHLLEYSISLVHMPPPSFLAIFNKGEVDSWGFLEERQLL